MNHERTGGAADAGRTNRRCASRPVRLRIRCSCGGAHVGGTDRVLGRRRRPRECGRGLAPRELAPANLRQALRETPTFDGPIQEAPRPSLRRPDWIEAILEFCWSDGEEDLADLPLAMTTADTLRAFGPRAGRCPGRWSGARPTGPRRRRRSSPGRPCSRLRRRPASAGSRARGPRRGPPTASPGHPLVGPRMAARRPGSR